MKSNIHKKLTFEDRFDRKYACWVKNNPKAWRWWKRRNRKKYKRMLKDRRILKDGKEPE